MSKNQKYKVSLFAHRENTNLIWNDLESCLFQLSENEIDLLEKIELSQELDRTDINAGEDQSFHSLLEKGLIIPVLEREDGKFKLKRVDIETVSHCNAKCLYCPQSIHKRPKGIMSNDFFREILKRLEHEKPDWIATAHFGEPLLDPGFEKKVEMLSNHDHRYLFFTNASLLTKERLSFLATQNIHSAFFNFPSLNKSEWAYFMQLPEKQFNMAKNGIAKFANMLDGKLEEIGIVVNGITENQVQRVEKIKKYFQDYGNIRVLKCESNSRAGAIKNNMVTQYVNDQKYFYGCDYPVSELNITINGDCILCCHDYYREIVLGNIMSKSIREITQSETANYLRAEIFGQRPMRKKLLCRMCDRIRKERKVILST